MAISPPSDIVLDVALAADPTRREAATRRLAAASQAADGFGAALTTSSVSTANVQRSSVALPRSTTTGLDPFAKAVGGLETFFLRTAFEQMLPDSRMKTSIPSGGGIWKSMLAAALATHVSASGALDLGLKTPATQRSAT